MTRQELVREIDLILEEYGHHLDELEIKALNSNCFKVTIQEKWGVELRYYDYRPNCGARME